jgi:hypothetical protein
MSTGRKFRRAQKGDPLPRSWGNVAEKRRAELDAALKVIVQMLPDRPVVLLTAPPNSSFEDVEAFGCAYNVTDRSLVANMFQAMLDWWSGDVILAQPDRAAVTALREGVASIGHLHIGELARGLGAATVDLLKTIEARKVGTAGDIVTNSVGIAATALAIMAKFIEHQQHEPEGGTADASGAPQPAPMPPPREWPPGDTKSTLVADLLERPPSEDRDQIIEMARAGRFHIHESESATPKSDLVDVLARYGFPDLAGKARDGGYDHEPATLEQVEELRRDVGPEAFDALTGNDPGRRGQA